MVFRYILQLMVFVMIFSWVYSIKRKTTQQIRSRNCLSKLRSNQIKLWYISLAAIYHFQKLIAKFSILTFDVITKLRETMQNGTISIRDMKELRKLYIFETEFDSDEELCLQVNEEDFYIEPMAMDEFDYFKDCNENVENKENVSKGEMTLFLEENFDLVKKSYEALPLNEPNTPQRTPIALRKNSWKRRLRTRQDKSARKNLQVSFKKKKKKGASSKKQNLISEQSNHFKRL